MDNEIVSLKFDIKKLSVEIKSLEKRLAQKKKSKLLYPEEEEELLGQISERKTQVAKLESDIRAIENNAVRSQNMTSQEIKI